MAKLPTDSPTVTAIYKYHETRAKQGHRPHLGGSLIGHECDRHLFYSFRWSLAKYFDGRMLRLFETGELAEDRFVTELRGIGATVWAVDPDNGMQWRVSDHGGHFSGSLDGVAVGIESSTKPHVLEFKTHNAKSFKELKAKGVQAAKPQHYAQMQVYGYLMDIDRALYVAVNKDTDELYSERIKINRTEGKRLVDRASRVIFTDRPPERMSQDPAFFKCKFCDHHPICHGYKPPEANCRTCAFVTPMDDGTWRCEHHDKTLTTDNQRVGCDQHLYNPEMLNIEAEQFDPDSHRIIYKAGLVNGKGGFTSAEIATVDDVRAIDDTVKGLAESMGAKLVEDPE